jgi:hypothetical protein
MMELLSSHKFWLGVCVGAIGMYVFMLNHAIVTPLGHAFY